MPLWGGGAFFENSMLYDSIFGFCIRCIMDLCFVNTMIWPSLLETSIDEDSINWHYGG